MKIEQLQKAIDSNFNESVSFIQDIIKVPNVITDCDAIDKVVKQIAAKLRDLGAETIIWEGGELPIIYAFLDEGAEKTVIVFKNIDIIPPEDSGWKFNPFGGHIALEPGVGDVIYGSGVAEPKGPLAALLAGLSAYKKEFGKLPVNLVFIIETDEQIGSPTLPKLIQEKKEELMSASAGIFPEFSQSSKGEAIIPLSVKGIVYLELICRGGEWGGPGIISLHSSNAAWIKSPVWRLTQALDSMVDSEENILISGFLEGVREIDRSVDLISSGRTHDMIEFMRIYTKRFKYDLDERELILKYMGNPTFNISSIMTFQSRRWMKFVLPHEVRACLDIRLVPDMDPEKVIHSIRDHLDGYGYKDIEMLVHMKYPSWRIDAEHPLISLLKKTYESIGVRYGILPCSGTSLPLYVFDKVLDKPLLIAGLGRAGRAYHANEFLPLESIKRFQLSLCTLLQAISGHDA